MKSTLSALAFAAALGLSGTAFAQVPSGGPDAKGNAPIKHAHTVNDGSAKRGHNSFTQKQAQQHIAHAGYSGVSDLVKGDDGVWRGMAMKNGATVQVGLDFKGNVSEGGATAMSSVMTTTTATRAAGPTRMEASPAPMPMAAPAGMATSTGMAASSTEATTTSTASTTGARATHHRRHHRRHAMRHCTQPGVNGTACSGVDRNRNGISDKEDRAIKGGAKP